MKNLQTFLWSSVLCVMLHAFACVTVNIYFPAEQVESIAGEIVNDIRSQEGAEEQTSLRNKRPSFLQRAILLLSPSSAHAQEVIDVSNPTIRALKEKMKARYNQLEPYYKKNMLQEGDDGYVSIAHSDELGLKEKRDLKALIDAENRDRETLYSEVAKALVIDSSQIHKVAEIFAKEWQKPIQ